MRISDWSSDVCSSDLRAGILWQKRDGLGLLEVVEALAECFASSRESRLVDSACTIGDERRQYVETRVIQDPVLDGKQDVVDRAIDSARPVVRLPSARRDDQHGSLSRHRAFSVRSEEHTSELQSLMRISYAV